MLPVVRRNSFGLQQRIPYTCKTPRFLDNVFSELLTNFSETSLPEWNLSTPHEAMTCIKANTMDIVLYIVLSSNHVSTFSEREGRF